MALIADIRTSVKYRLDIGVSAPDTSFDTIIDQFINDMVKRLWPRASREVPEQEAAVTVDDRGQASVNLTTLTTPCDGFRLIDADDGNGEWPVTDTLEHGGVVRLRGLTSEVSVVHVYGLAKFTLDNLNSEFELPLIYYTVSEFYNHLVGDKRLYNQYMANGRPAVDNMKDLADEYEAKADVILDEKAVMYGRQ